VVVGVVKSDGAVVDDGVADDGDGDAETERAADGGGSTVGVASGNLRLRRAAVLIADVAIWRGRVDGACRDADVVEDGYADVMKMVVEW
jgi:hypothetical protein